MVLYKRHHNGSAVRSLGLHACDLIIDEYHQFGLLPEMVKNEKEQRLEETMDTLRSRFGHFSIERGLMFVDRALTGINPKDEHRLDFFYNSNGPAPSDETPACPLRQHATAPSFGVCY